MAERVYTPGATWPCAIIATVCLLPWAGAMAAEAFAQPNLQQAKQQRRAQTEARRALEESERRIATSQAEQIREAQERSEQQRRALAETDRRREAEQHYEEFLLQTRAQQSKPPQPQDEGKLPQISSEPAAATLPTSAVEPQPRRYLFLRRAGLVLMIGASLAALFVLGRIVRDWLAR